MTEGQRRAALEAVAAEVRACTRCRLHEGRQQAVPGEGHPSTEVLFVGEGPGLNEDRQGRPFVGAAGGFLTELLGAVGWTRDEVFITNVVKCRPPQNRDPEPDEIAACAPFLRRQAEILDPALVVTLGRHSMGRFMPGARIGQVHGTTAPAPAETGATDALVFAMYHPAAALHQASLRQTLLDDMTGVPSALLEARRRRAETRADAAAEPRAEVAASAERPVEEPPVVGAGAAEAPPPTDAATVLEQAVATPVGSLESAPELAAPLLLAAPLPPAARPEPVSRPEPTPLALRDLAPLVPDPDVPPALVPGLDGAPGADQMTLF
ncbi:MAG TPA: uracil-DNA glycosylase [Candidatus Dormibacteraeota bacterium]|nr:uracil-DNA glycosylase [Candidatus Dormibacteraeota bacterium]